MLHQVCLLVIAHRNSSLVGDANIAKTFLLAKPRDIGKEFAALPGTSGFGGICPSHWVSRGTDEPGHVTKLQASECVHT